MADASDLWTRLLAGHVTEVCVLSYRGLYRDLPQTLGLEVIPYEAYRYDSRGVPRAPEELDEIARQLAAESRWLAIGGPRFWVEHFARRAEAILVMPASPDVELDAGIDAALYALGRFLKSRLTRRRGRTAAERSHWSTPTREFSGDVPRSNAERAAYFVQTENFLLGEFPGKTFVLDDGDLAGKLHSVRALRGQPDERTR